MREKEKIVPGATEDLKGPLLQAACQLFAQHGLDGTKVRDIADRAGASLCLISYHFGGKEGLYRACLEEFGRERMELAKEILEEVESVEEFRVRLKLFLKTLTQAYATRPELVKILSREIEAGLPVAQDIFEKTFLKSFQALIDYFKSAQKRGFVLADIDPLCSAALIYGGLK